jgi:hypothetical protein
MHPLTPYTHTYHGRGKVSIREKYNLGDSPPCLPDILDLSHSISSKRSRAVNESAHLFRQGKKMIIDQ